jgi:hypothetical protein
MTTKILGNQITNYTINTEQLSNTATAAFAKTLAPKILYANVTSNTYSVLDDTSVNVGGGYIVITGAEFQSGATVLIDTTLASSVTYVNSTTLRAQVPAKSAASYNLYVVNPDGGTGLKVSGITYSGSPTWVTTSPLANLSSNTVFSGNFSATGATSYANTTILPTGFNLLANGYYYGNISVGAETTYSFTIRATDSELQDSDKTFSLTAVTLAPTYTAYYMVVAGGGAGGDGDAGGGGAGGMLTGNTTVIRTSTYTVTVGSGAAGQSNSGGRGPAGIGGNSQIAAPTVPSFTTVLSYGGGAGGGYNQGGTPGGSGGGASNVRGGQGSGVPGQGNPGGGSPVGGGGGAGGAGQGGAGYGSGVTGGPGALWPYTNTTYAGGGGAMSGAGGSGGGGNGDGSPGSTNTGGGGGGFRFSGGTGGSGGSGVVVLAVPTPNYPGSAPGATVTTPPAAPGMTVLTYNSSGTFTA